MKAYYITKNIAQKIKLQDIDGKQCNNFFHNVWNFDLPSKPISY